MNKSFASLLATAACFSMAATPALARDRGWGGGGWGGGYRGGGWGHHHDDGIDGGDILAGLLIFGTIAVVASAASKSAKEKREAEENGGYRYPDEQRQAPRYDDRPSGSGSRDWGRSRSIDGAVDTCVAEVERGSARVDTVDSVDRDGEGWRVSGKVRSGAPYACSVGSDGRVRNLSVDGKAPY